MSTSKNNPRTGTDKSHDSSVPQAVVIRLSLYLRELQRLLQDDQQTTSSTQLGQLLGFTDAQVRKDLAYFGQFGHPGIGYRSGELVEAIRRILGTDRTWPLALIGLGNLGRALVGYRGFSQQGFEIVSAFDADPSKAGSEFEGIRVYSMERLTEVARDNNIHLAILAVPANAAQEVADQLVSAGFRGILNFAPVTLSLPAGVQLISVDLAIQLEQLTFAVVKSISNT